MEERLICSICYEGFDQTDHVPRVLPQCGHTLCSPCILNILKEVEPKCPLDKLKFSYQHTTLEHFPINYTVKQLIEGRADKGFCQKHKADMILACFTDKKKICAECLWRDGHEGHKMKSLDAIKSETTKPKKQLEGLMEELEKCEKEVRQTLEKEKALCMGNIKSVFERIRSVLFSKELELSFEAESFFDKEIKRSDSLISNLKEQLNQRISSVRNICSHEDALYTENLFEETESFVKGFAPNLSSQKIKKEIEALTKELDEANQSFTNSIGDHVDFWSKLEIPLKRSSSLDEIMNVFVERRGDKRSEETLENCMLCLKAPVNFKIDCNNDSLVLLLDKSQSTEAGFSLKNLSTMKEAKIELKNKVTEKLDLQVLNYILKQLQKKTTMCLKISPEALSDELYQVLAMSTSHITEAEIVLEGHKHLNNQNRIVGLVEKMLDENKQMSLVLNNSWMEMKSFRSYIRNGGADTANLHSFTLNLGDQDVGDQVVCDMLVPMPNLKKVKFDIKKTKITDKAIELLITNTLAVAENLEDVSITLFRTGVTDNSLSNFVIKSRKLKFLFLDLGMTRITNYSFKCIVDALVPNFGTLESFTLSLGDTNVGDELLQQMLTNVSMPCLKSFFLSAWSTAITDNTIETFVDTSLNLMSALKSLTLWLNETKVSDKSMKKLIANLKDLNQLRLNLQSTHVTDDSIAGLKEVLPTMKSLERLEIEVSNTKVSSQLQNEILEIKNNLLQAKKTEPVQKNVV